MINTTKIKDIREDNDITQEQMAQILGVKRSAYSLWEIGISVMPIEHLSDFADYFNYSIDYVLGLSDDRNINLIKGIDFQVLGNNIKTYRLKRKFSQIGLASRLGVTQACIVRWEKGITKISVPNLYKLSKILNVSINDICGKTEIKEYIPN